jgi:hypothetical protein
MAECLSHQPGRAASPLSCSFTCQIEGGNPARSSGVALNGIADTPDNQADRRKKIGLMR